MSFFLKREGNFKGKGVWGMFGFFCVGRKGVVLVVIEVCFYFWKGKFEKLVI